MPAVIVAGEAVNEGMLGVPAQTGVLVAVGWTVAVAVAVAGADTTMDTVIVPPKKEPVGERIVHCPVYVPGVAGAIIDTVKSRVALGLVARTV